MNPEPARGIPLEPESGFGIQKEQGAAETAPRATASPVEKSDASLLDFADKDDILAPAVVPPSRLPELAKGYVLDEGREGAGEPTKPYVVELAESFFFFLDGGSFVTFLFITLIQSVALGFNAQAAPSPALGGLTVVFGVIVWGYLCTFYMAVVKEAAGGEDELPNVLADSAFDLVGGLICFLGSWIWILLPAIAYILIVYVNYGLVNWPVAATLAVIGLFFWPVVILGVSLGGGFYGLWPHTIIRTAAAAPLAYLAMCVVLLIAAGLNALPYMDIYYGVLTKLSTKTGQSLSLVIAVFTAGLNSYAMIVAMRAIGLYYRHYKRKFPWVAE